MAIVLHGEDAKCKVVPYSGSVPAVKDLLAGVLDFCIPNAGGYITYREEIHALATLTDKQTTLVPDAPPITDAYKYPVASGWNYWAVKKGTPMDRVKVLQDAMAQVFKDPSYAKKVAEIGWGMAGRTPESYETTIKETQKVLKTGVEASKWEAGLKF
jgi:tripartite-type tricarboxylate transporter receptor subunit TctC